MVQDSAARKAFVALLALALCSAAAGDERKRVRLTIRGTGSNVGIEQTQAPARKRPFGKNALHAGAIGEAIRLKASGAEDAAVINYLRAHQLELPPIVDAADVRQLRQAGAGKPVVAFLSTVAAVDIGETGEGYETVVANAPPAATAFEPYVSGAPYGYPLAGGYVAPYPVSTGFVFTHRPVSRPPRHVFRGIHTPHPGPIRRPMQP